MAEALPGDGRTPRLSLFVTLGIWSVLHFQLPGYSSQDGAKVHFLFCMRAVKEKRFKSCWSHCRFQTALSLSCFSAVSAAMHPGGHCQLVCAVTTRTQRYRQGRRSPDEAVLCHSCERGSWHGDASRSCQTAPLRPLFGRFLRQGDGWNDAASMCFH